MAKRVLVLCCVLAILCSGSAFAQQPPANKKSHKYRTLFTIAGGAGGAVVGLFTGLSAFDDAPYSERKVTTVTILSGAGGAIGGYFLGRAVDKNRKITGWPTEHNQFVQLAGRSYPSVESLGIVRSLPQIRKPELPNFEAE